MWTEDTLNALIFSNIVPNDREQIDAAELRDTLVGMSGAIFQAPPVSNPEYLQGAASTPSSVAADPAIWGFSDPAGVACVFGTYDSAPYPAWIQTRDLNFNNSLPLLLNPVKGGVVIGSLTAAPGIPSGNGLQINPYWANTPTYAPPGGTSITSALLLNSNDSGFGGVQSFVRTSTTTGTAQGLSSYAFADNTAALGAWPFYTEGHRLTKAGYAYGLGEASSINRHSEVLEINPLNIPDPTTGGAVGFQVEAGDGSSIAVNVQYSSSVAQIIQSNFNADQSNAYGFAHGIVFRLNALDATLFNPPDAIALAGNTYKHAISWWSSGSNRAWLIYSDAASGNNTLDLTDDTAKFSSAVATAPVHYAALPSAPTVGTIACVDNSSVNTWGGTADGAGSDKVLVWWNGSAWTVIGK